MQLNRLLPAPQPKVEEFHEQGEGNGEIQVAFGDGPDRSAGQFYVRQVGALGDQHEADQQQEGQPQHLDGRVPVDEPGYRCGEQHHDEHGKHDREDHDGQGAVYAVGHPDRRQDGIKGEYDIDHRDLQNGVAERRTAFAFDTAFTFLPLQLVVDLRRAFIQQEQPAGNQDQALP